MIEGNTPDAGEPMDALNDEEDIIIIVEDEEGGPTHVELPPPPAPAAPAPAPDEESEYCGDRERDLEDMAPGGLAGGSQTDDY